MNANVAVAQTSGMAASNPFGGAASGAVGFGAQQPAAPTAGGFAFGAGAAMGGGFGSNGGDAAAGGFTIGSSDTGEVCHVITMDMEYICGLIGN